MKRIYLVEIRLEVMVCAESAEEAERYAARNSADMISEESHNADANSLGEVTNPSEEYATSIPWGYDGDEERTVGEWVALAKAAVAGGAS